MKTLGNLELKANDRFKDDINNEIIMLLTMLTEIDQTMENNYDTISTMIKDEPFCYLSVKNSRDCTINSTFNLIVNYALYSQFMKIGGERIIKDDEAKLEELKEMFKQYLTEWYAFFLSILEDRQKGHKTDPNMIKQLDQSQEEKIVTMIELLFSEQQLDLRFIHCCSFMLHMIIYTKCITEHVLSYSDFDPNFSSVMDVYNLGYQTKDTIEETEFYYDRECIKQTGTIERKEMKNDDDDIEVNVHFRRSNRYANYLLKLFCNKFNKIRANDVILLTDLKSDNCLNTSALESKSEKYNYCIAKYFGGTHANVIIFKLRENTIIERFLVEDIKNKYDRTAEIGVFTDRSKNKVRLIPPGFYIAVRPEVPQSYSTGSLTPNFLQHIPSALLFNGGFMQSILIVILIIAIIVCVVIYIHNWFSVSWANTDRKYVKAQQRILDKK